MTNSFEPTRGENRRVLIVDDDQAVLKALSEYFEHVGYVVVRAETGRQGIAAHESQEPDVTILDLHLPDIGGIEVLETLRRKRAMVILLTGYGDIPTAVKAMQLGAENFLTKPVDLPHLVASVERAIEKVDLRRENVRLRKLIPTTRKKLVQLVATLALVAGSLFIGRLVGGIGNEQREMPQIAPTRPAAPAPGVPR